MKTLNPKRVRQLFDYIDGSLVWAERPLSDFKTNPEFKRWHARYCGKIAGHIAALGHRAVRITVDGKKKNFKEHRLIWAWHYGEWPRMQLEHIDHNQLNNRIENLREVTDKENNRNASLRKDNTSGVVGVNWSLTSSKWHSRIYNYGERFHLGYFDCFGKAVRARKAAERNFNYHPNHGKSVGDPSNV